jgi:hypothetical protein
MGTEKHFGSIRSWRLAEILESLETDKELLGDCVCKPRMMAFLQSGIETEERRITDIRHTRMRALFKTWRDLHENVSWIKLFTINHAIATKVVLRYVGDLEILKFRYCIDDKALPPKVAGLMANAILKYRPLVPNNPKEVGIEKKFGNELLAIHHGLSVCSEYYSDIENSVKKDILQKQNFGEWLNKFVFLLSERNYTPENLVMVFETLC